MFRSTLHEIHQELSAPDRGGSGERQREEEAGALKSEMLAGGTAELHF